MSERADRNPGADRRLVVAVAALATGAVVLRFLTLDLQSFGHDEAVTVTRVLFPELGETLDAVLRSERSGPVYYVLAWSWTRVFGIGEIGIRSLSAICGALTVPVAYLIAAELASRRAGLIAAALVALNPLLFWYSQEARAYSLFVLLGALALLFFARALSEGGGRTRTGSLAWWVTWSALSLATHYFALFLIAPQALWLLWTRRDRRAWLAVGALMTIGLALLPIALHQQQKEEAGISGRALAGRALQAGVMFTGGGEPQLGSTVGEVGRTSLVLACLVVLLALLALALLLRRSAPVERRGGLVAGGVGVLALVTPLALAVAGLDLLKHRNLIGALVPLIVAMTSGFGTRRSGWLGLGGATLLAAVFAVGLVGQLSSEELQRRDVRAAVSALGPAQGPRLVLGPNHDDDPLLHYLGSNAGYKLDNPRRTVFVQEIAVVSVEPPAVFPPPVRGFELLEQSAAGAYRVYEYRAPVPRRVRLADLPAEQLVGEPYAAITGV